MYHILRHSTTSQLSKLRRRRPRAKNSSALAADKDRIRVGTKNPSVSQSPLLADWLPHLNTPTTATYNLHNLQANFHSCLLSSSCVLIVVDNVPPHMNMALIATSTDSNANVSATTIPKEANLEQNLEKANNTVTTTIEQELSSQEQNGSGSTETRIKKSSSFKLAFVGIAASLFVFQLDATCLGIALPVSLEILFFLNITSRYSLILLLRP